jgi:transcriptional regulator GlxA family with amidase domain
MPFPPVPAVLHFAFLTLDRYSMIAFANAVEALRMANYASGRTLYRWSVVTLDGAPATASNGLPVTPTLALARAGRPDLLFVCGGVDVHTASDQALSAALAQSAREGVMLGGLCTGSYALIKAGLMKGYRCAIHWENMAALREEFPRVIFTDGLFAADRERFTCSGGTAPIDMMLHLIAGRHGGALAERISSQFMLARVRGADHQQHIPTLARLGYSRTELIRAAALMEQYIEEPLSMAEIARLVGLSPRQLQRMFKHYTQTSPIRYYLQLRLRRARELLSQSGMSVMSVTVACGFRSAAHFSKSYREQFGCSPSRERRAEGVPG